MEAGYDQGHARDLVPTAADAPEPAARQHLGWMISESGPAGAQHAILMIPGGLCPASFYEDVIEELRRRDANLRFVATTIPGHAGTPPPDDMGQDTYARSAGQLAKDLGCDVVVGHSMGANVAIEMAASGVYSGRVVLLSPAFSHGDEASFLWVLDRIGRIPALGGLAWKAMTAMIPSGMKGSLPSEHRQAWMAQLKKNDWRHFRSAVRSYSEYLSGQPALVGRLCDSGVKAWVAFDGPKDTRLTDGERRVLDACTTVHLVDWPEAGHYTLGETASVADLISEAASVA